MQRSAAAQRPLPFMPAKSHYQTLIVCCGQEGRRGLCLCSPLGTGSFVLQFLRCSMSEVMNTHCSVGIKRGLRICVVCLTVALRAAMWLCPSSCFFCSCVLMFSVSSFPFKCWCKQIWLCWFEQVCSWVINFVGLFRCKVRNISPEWHLNYEACFVFCKTMMLFAMLYHN